MKSLTVADLRKRLEGFPDDAILVKPISDHGYRRVSVSLETAVKEGGELSESGEGLEPGQTEVKVVVVS